uniref:Uncharacterized protein MANES_15G052700 n=1 Tax=Rhizophora mucronata TaxID=61149 RepID=A0A2P2IRS8_RHIMU
MGKYMRKTKPTAEVGVMDVNVTIGVRTRAKTLAQRQAMAAPPAAAAAASGGYLQLRSRRLEKPPIALHHSNSKRQKYGNNRLQSAKTILNPNSKSGSRVRTRTADSGSRASAQKEEESAMGENRAEEDIEKNDDEIGGNPNSIDNENESKDLGIEASFGENFLDVEGRDRSTRESTPCSLIREPEAIRTPGSTTRPTSSTETNRRILNSLRGNTNIPTAQEMDDFFAGAEQEQQRQFIEKYNFDPVNDKPLAGRYKWEKLDP